MNIKTCIALLILLGAVVFVPSTSADTYATFQTTRYYSANRRYFEEVTEKKRATLYRNGRNARRVWSRMLPEFPGTLFVTNDGSRSVIVDRYYGNRGSPQTPVVILLDETGTQIASHRLGDVANLDRTLQTISAAHWCGETKLSPDEQSLLIESRVLRVSWDECRAKVAPHDSGKCWETIPYQHLKFALATGELIERLDLAVR